MCRFRTCVFFPGSCRQTHVKFQIFSCQQHVFYEQLSVGTPISTQVKLFAYVIAGDLTLAFGDFAIVCDELMTASRPSAGRSCHQSRWRNVVGEAQHLLVVATLFHCNGDLNANVMFWSCLAINSVA
jgi:hypothetical protein